MRRALATLAPLVALALMPVAPGAQTHEHDGAADIGAHVSIRFGSIEPTRVDVVAGEATHWTNDSVRKHTVTDDGGAFDSGTLAVGSSYQHVFESAGEFSYHCTLHPYIRGRVAVHRVLIDPPAGAAAAGRPFPLRGRSSLPAGTELTIESDEGGGWHAVGATTVAPGGEFAGQVVPQGSASYRVAAADAVSPPVTVLVLNRTVTATARGLRGGRSRVSATVTPPAPGATVVLQMYLKERFGWWPVARRRLDRRSRATFVVGHRRAVSARVVLTLPDAATPLSRSQVLRLRW